MEPKAQRGIESPRMGREVDVEVDWHALEALLEANLRNDENEL